MTVGTPTITAEYAGNTDWSSSTGTLASNQTVNNVNLFLPLVLR